MHGPYSVLFPELVTQFADIAFDVSNGVARIRFRRPEALNAFTRVMAFEILEALDTCATDDGIRTVVFTGEGRAFSTGADVRGKRAMTPDGEVDLSANMHQAYNPLILRIRQLPKPVIAAVNGPAAGLGCSLACACDFIVACESAYFLLAFVRIGLVPDGGALLTIPARIGSGRALQLAMLGDRLAAPEAKEWGLINDVWADDEFESQVAGLAARLAAGPAGAYAVIKDMFNRTHLAELEAQLALEAVAQYKRGLSAEYAEGTKAFLEKRDADFLNAGSE